MLIHVNTLRTNIDSPAECSPADIYKVSKYERQGMQSHAPQLFFVRLWCENDVVLWRSKIIINDTYG